MAVEVTNDGEHYSGGVEASVFDGDSRPQYMGGQHILVTTQLEDDSENLS